MFLAGFATLGIYAFKVTTPIFYLSWIKFNRHQLTTEQMDAQAGAIVDFC